MANYTIEDIECIRRKSGISYQEAVALLEYHNGNVARALIDLERNGKLLDEEQATKTKKSEKKESNGLLFLYAARVKISYKNSVVLNLSVAACAACLVFCPYMVLAGLVVTLILGYKVTFVRSEPAFSGKETDSSFEDAARQLKDRVQEMAREFKGTEEKSYYSGEKNRTAQPRKDGSVPTIQVPLKVKSKDGSVRFDQDDDGYNRATLE